MKNEFKIGYHWYNNGKINKQLKDTDIIPEEFIKGRLKTGKFKGGWKYRPELNQEIIDKRNQSIRKTYQDNKELRNKISNSIKEKYKDESFKEKQRKNTIKAMQKESYSINMSNAIKNIYIKNPNLREKRSEISRNHWKDKIASAKHLRHLKTKYGQRIKYKNITYRSKIELNIAKALDELEISFEYESLRIEYIYKSKEHTYIPDFYLPKYNLIIEGKPSSELNNQAVILKKEACISLGYKYIFLGNHSKNILISKIKAAILE